MISPALFCRLSEAWFSGNNDRSVGFTEGHSCFPVCVFPLNLTVAHRRIFMFQLWKSITRSRVPPSSCHSKRFLKDSRWFRFLLLRRICPLPLLSSGAWYMVLNCPCTCHAGFSFQGKHLNKLFIKQTKRSCFEFSWQSFVSISLQYCKMEREAWWSS